MKRSGLNASGSGANASGHMFITDVTAATLVKQGGHKSFSIPSNVNSMTDHIKVVLCLPPTCVPLGKVCCPTFISLLVECGIAKLTMGMCLVISWGKGFFFCLIE